MSRPLRIEYPGAVYHIMCRGNRGTAVFSSESEAELWQRTLEEAVHSHGWRIHAWVLMKTHYHLLLETPEANLVVGMKWFQGTFTKRLNASQQTWGHVYQGRYKAKSVEDGDAAYFGQVADYIHLNPVAAGLVNDGSSLKAYAWSSYPAYLKSPRHRSDWLHTQRVLSAAGIPGDTSIGRAAYEARMNVKTTEARAQLARNEEPAEWKNFERGWVHGSRAYRQRLIEALKENARLPALRMEDSEQRRDYSETGAGKFLDAGLNHLDLTRLDLTQMNKSDPLKKLLAGCLKSGYAVSNRWISEQLRMGDRAAVSRSMAFFRKPPKKFLAIKKGLVKLQES